MNIFKNTRVREIARFLFVGISYLVGFFYAFLFTALTFFETAFFVGRRDTNYDFLLLLSGLGILAGIVIPTLISFWLYPESRKAFMKFGLGALILMGTLYFIGLLR